MNGEEIADSEPESPPITDTESITGAGDGEVAGAPPAQTGWRSSPVRSALIIGLTVVVALTGLSGWLGYRAYQQKKAEEFRQLLIQTGRQGAVNLTTIDFEHADDDVKRILDSATGQFYDEFSSRSAPFIELVEKAKSKTEGTVTESGIESVDGEQGQVLVAVSVKTTNQGTAEEKPRYWRMRMTITRQGKDAKVSKVDFVP